ncbi:MAG TPA: T9SS type A sorting domain-containing protein [Bacteroidia bacterium]|nr:T9SS type A sorting domain-containing protein [Bacteroidia bacterium]
MKKTLLLLFVSALPFTGIYAQAVANSKADINGVSAMVNANGDLFWNYQTAEFEVPKGSQKNTIFAGAMWIGGLDTSGQLHLAAQTYRQSGNDFYPGPVMDSANYSAATDAQWNKVWKINKTSIDSFCTWTVNHSVYPNYTIPSSILNWPGNGNVALGEAAILAPFVDQNSDGVYDPNNGDYPCIKGDQAVFFIFNDDRNAHTETGGQKMKIEVHAMAYSFISPGTYLDSTVFLNYKIINRSSNDYSNCQLGSWIDFDIGSYNDDYVGCSVQQQMFYGYNGDANDGSSAIPTLGTYGANPPAEGVVFLRGPEADPNDGIDNNRDGIVDEPGEYCRMNHFVYYNNDFSVTGNPQLAIDYYNYMNGFWKDTTHITYGGTGYGGALNTDCMFPGASDPSGACSGNMPQAPWDEMTANNTPGDRRGMASSGQFTLSANEEMCVDLALVYARGTAGPASSVTLLEADADSVSNFYLSTSPCSCVPNPLAVHELNDSRAIGIYPNPSGGNITVNWKPQTVNAKLEVIDVNGKVVLVQTINRALTEINTDQLANGIYLIRITDGNETASTKLIRQ